MLEKLTERKNWPLIRINIAVITPILGIVFLQVFYFRAVLEWNFYTKLWFLFGLVYTHFFEYGHHSGPMHTLLEIKYKAGITIVDRIISSINNIFRAIKHSHTIHHRKFSITKERGNNLQSNDKEDLKHITGPWWFFMSALSVHYLIMINLVSVNSLTFFAVATAGHYLLYEGPHFLAHSKDNKIDRVLFKIPVIGVLRQEWIKFHLQGDEERPGHHMNPQVNYSVTPPFLDWLFGTLSRKKANPA